MNLTINEANERRAKTAQDYDPSPPRCMTCVYHRREPAEIYKEREIVTPRGKHKTIRVRIKAHPTRNPIVDRCTFGNFLVKPSGVCDEWHSREGERIETPTLQPEERDDGG